ncbi:MAG: hypothetical protein NC181_04185 [Clostridium sp.]|nr:hypothetical protein [Clostridium sp.]MCM1444454.1 hypothetical protein [Candidatus Amulumruptor caecigallinarius]
MNNIKEKLKKLTNRSDDEIAIIDEILNNHFIVGKNNKKKIVEDFKANLNLTDNEADNLYNQCSEIIVKGIFKRD